MDRRLVADILKPHVPADPVGKCRKAVDEAFFELSREVDCEVVEGHFCGRATPEGEGQAYHWYIRIPADADTGQPTLIADPTVSQFVEENYFPNQNTGVNAYVPEAHIPSDNVISPSSPLFDAYQ